MKVNDGSRPPRRTQAERTAETRARLIETAVALTLSSGTTPMEFGGGADCAAVTRATIAALPAAIRNVA